MKVLVLLNDKGQFLLKTTDSWDGSRHHYPAGLHENVSFHSRGLGNRSCDYPNELYSDDVSTPKSHDTSEHTIVAVKAMSSYEELSHFKAALKVIKGVKINEDHTLWTKITPQAFNEAASSLVAPVVGGVERKEEDHEHAKPTKGAIADQSQYTLARVKARYDYLRSQESFSGFGRSKPGKQFESLEALEAHVKSAKQGSRTVVAYKQVMAEARASVGHLFPKKLVEKKERLARLLCLKDLAQDGFTCASAKYAGVDSKEKFVLMKNILLDSIEPWLVEGKDFSGIMAPETRQWAAKGTSNSFKSFFTEYDLKVGLMSVDCKEDYTKVRNNFLQLSKGLTLLFQEVEKLLLECPEAFFVQLYKTLGGTGIRPGRDKLYLYLEELACLRASSNGNRALEESVALSNRYARLLEDNKSESYQDELRVLLQDVDDMLAAISPMSALSQFQPVTKVAHTLKTKLDEMVKQLECDAQQESKEKEDSEALVRGLDDRFAILKTAQEGLTAYTEVVASLHEKIGQNQAVESENLHALLMDSKVQLNEVLEPARTVQGYIQFVKSLVEQGAMSMSEASKFDDLGVLCEDVLFGFEVLNTKLDELLDVTEVRDYRVGAPKHRAHDAPPKETEEKSEQRAGVSVIGQFGRRESRLNQAGSVAGSEPSPKPLSANSEEETMIELQVMNRSPS